MVTGWGVVVPAHEDLELVERLRDTEAHLRQASREIGLGRSDSATWRVIADGVPEAMGWEGSGMPVVELFQRALDLRGPLNGSYASLLMHERARIFLRASLPDDSRHTLSRTPANLLSL